MQIYDISQEVFTCAVYPGDPKPEKQTLCSVAAGDSYNLTAFSMCAHNGTHVDAPFHFLADGRTVEQMELELFVGECYVARHEGDVSAVEAEMIFISSIPSRARLPILCSKGSTSSSSLCQPTPPDAGIIGMDSLP